MKHPSFKYFTLFILLVVSPDLYSQRKSKRQALAWIYFSGFYGQNFYLKPFIKEISNLNNFDMKSPVHYIGLKHTFSKLSIARMNYKTYIAINQYLPANVKIYDSLCVKLNGFNLKLGILSYDFHIGRSIIIKPITTINFGRTTIKKDISVSKNNFIIGELGSGIYIKVKKVYLDIDLGYMYDFSTPRWIGGLSYGNKNLILPNFNQSGVRVNIGLGYCLK